MSELTKDRSKVAFCVIPAMVLPLISSLFYFVFFSGTTFANILYTSTKVFTLVWPIIAILVIEKNKLVSKAYSLKHHLRVIPFGLITGGAVFVFAVVLYKFTPIGGYLQEFREPIKLKVESFGIMNHYILFGIFISLIHSLLEEYYWRWYVYGRLSKLISTKWAIVLAGLAFAAHHYVILGQFVSVPGAFIFGTLVWFGGSFWCWQIQKQQSLVGAWVGHALIDILIFYVGYDLIF